MRIIAERGTDEYLVARGVSKSSPGWIVRSGFVTPVDDVEKHLKFGFWSVVDYVEPELRNFIFSKIENHHFAENSDRQFNLAEVLTYSRFDPNFLAGRGDLFDRREKAREGLDRYYGPTSEHSEKFNNFIQGLVTNSHPFIAVHPDHIKKILNAGRYVNGLTHNTGDYRINSDGKESHSFQSRKEIDQRLFGLNAHEDERYRFPIYGYLSDNDRGWNTIQSDQHRHTPSWSRGHLGVGGWGGGQANAIRLAIEPEHKPRMTYSFNDTFGAQGFYQIPHGPDHFHHSMLPHSSSLTMDLLFNENELHPHLHTLPHNIEFIETHYHPQNEDQLKLGTHIKRAYLPREPVDELKELFDKNGVHWYTHEGESSDPRFSGGEHPNMATARTLISRGVSSFDGKFQRWIGGEPIREDEKHPEVYVYKH